MSSRVGLEQWDDRASRTRDDPAARTRDAADDLVREAAHHGAEAVDAAKRKGREMSHAMRDGVETMRNSLERSVERQPLAALGMAVLAGMVLATVMRR